MPSLEKALLADEVEQVVEVLVLGAGASIARFEESLPVALDGGFGAVQVLVTNWDALLEEILGSAGALQRVDWLMAALRASVAAAPFSRFVGAFGAGRGMALACVAEVRDSIPDLRPLARPYAQLPDLPAGIDVLRFRRLVDLAIRGFSPPLERLQEALGLSAAELGQLFGVSRQAIDQWKVRGVPADRRHKLADLVGVVDLLERKTKAGRLPLIARRPAAAFDGRTLLEMAEADRHEELREKLERAFDWSTTA